MSVTCDLDIRRARRQERDALLRFIAEMGFNARSAATWDGLGMTAMCAWRGDELIGAIPLEPRELQFAPGVVVPAVHQTVVAVAPDWRGRGVGSRMQAVLAEDDPPVAPLATVFREDPDSPAYRWYARNGFAPLMTIDAWSLETPGVISNPPEYSVSTRDDPTIDWEVVDGLWQDHCAGEGGFVCRAQGARHQWLAVHPYHLRYRFAVLLLGTESDRVGYAILGAGRLHSTTVRLEVLEYACAASAFTDLCQAVVHHAHDAGCRPVRWALAQDDPRAAVLASSGFTSTWSFDLLGKSLSPDAPALPDAGSRRRSWRYFSLDYA